MKDPKVVIVMPAYRAAETLERTVADIPPEIGAELILVDDASTDRTVEVAEALGIKVYVHHSNRGYGGNQKTCYVRALDAGADIVVLLHPDYQYDPRAVPLLIAPILAGNADMTFGSRFAGLGDPLGGGMPLYRYTGNRLTSTLENLMLGSRFTDMHSGMRAYTRSCLLALPFLGYSDDFVFDSEMLVDAVTLGQRVVEVPIPTRYTKESSSISIGRSLKYIGGSLVHTAQRTLQRGRRGSRTPATLPRRPRGEMLPHLGRVPSEPCVMCRGRHHGLVYPATASGELKAEEFRCTTSDLATHDDIVQCANCGLLSASTPLDTYEVRRGYEEVVDEEYLAEEDERRGLFEWFLGRLARYKVDGKQLFEIGSNVGLFLDTASKAGWDARGLEPSAWAVATGRDRYGVDLRQGVIEELEEPAKSVDVAVMLDVLEHLTDPLDGLRRVRPIVADNGSLLLSTVDASSIHARLTGERWPWFIRSHLYYFTPETLASMLQESGFEMVEWTTVPRWFHLSYVANRARELHPGLARAAHAITRFADPRIPAGWLGDICLVVARPV